MNNIKPLDLAGASILGELTELLARISHDLRTPLNAVIGFSDAMQNELFGPLGNSRYQEYARHIRQSGDQLLKATEQTLAMTSMLAAPKRPARIEHLQLDEVLANALAAYSGAIADLDCSVEISIDEALEVRGDAKLLPRAFRHIMEAVLARAVAGSQIRVVAIAHDGWVTITVSVCPVRELSLALPARQIMASERGLGREELPVWLARGLLELHGAKLLSAAGPAFFQLETRLEQAAQTEFLFALQS